MHDASFRRDADQNCDLPGYYAAGSGNLLATFREQPIGLILNVTTQLVFLPTFREQPIGLILNVTTQLVFIPTFREQPIGPIHKVITHRVLVIYYRRFSTTYRSKLQESRIKRKMDPLDCPKSR
jgi:hypothetical protein